MTTHGPRRVSAVDGLRVLLLAEAAGGVALAILLSLVATGMRDLAPDDIGADTGVRFVAAGTFLLGMAAAVAARGVRRRRRWSWTLAAFVQLVLGIGTGIVVLVADWHAAYLAGFLVAGAVLLVLSSAPVRRALGQE